MRILFSLLLIIPALLLNSCGSDSDSVDDDIDPTYMGGLWRGNLKLTNNECGFDFDAEFNFSHLVEQSYTIIDFEDEEGSSFLGNIVGIDGFSVDAPGPSDYRIPDGRSCDITYRHRYTGINHDDDPTAEVRYFVLADCADGTECKTEYSGEGGR